MVNTRPRCSILISILLCISTLASHAVAQKTSTLEERARWVEITHKLEAAPLDEDTNKQGEWALKRLMDVHDGALGR